MKTMTVDGACAAYSDEGEGDTIIFAHCTGGSHRLWKKIGRSLSSRYRIIAPDLFGYGASADWPEKRSAAVNYDVLLLEKLIEHTGRDVHLVGHSYGGAVCLETARRAAETGASPSGRIRSLCLIEPVAFHLFRLAQRKMEWASVLSLFGQLIQAVERGDMKTAANLHMNFWLGWLQWRLAPPRLRRKIVAVMPKLAQEMWTLLVIEHALETYRAIDSRTTLIMGDKCNVLSKSILEIIEDLLVEADRKVVAGAGHMSPYTHEKHINRLVQEHFSY